MSRDATLQKYATAAVPRYTSYPSVPHFNEDFPPATYRQWLGRLDVAEPVSLYLHVPFCRQVCWYCGCNMKLVSRYEVVADYVEGLLRELQLACDALPGRMTVSHLHFGGGTPTVLDPFDLERVMTAIRDRFDFAADAEIAIESDPRTLTGAMTRRIGGLGFNRASFGVQEFDPKVQAAINRIQPADMVRDAIDGLREAGVGGINIDLIYGLPHQTVASLAATIEACIAMRPDRVALFGYAHVPWMSKKQRRIPEDALPGTAERAAQAAAAAQALAAGGYEAIGLDHFALPDDDLAAAARAGRLHRNFQGYTTDAARTLIGLGVTSIGRTPDGYVQNQGTTGLWKGAVERGEFPVVKGHELTEEDRLRAHVIERLMCDGEVDLHAIGRSHGRADDWYADALDALGEMAADGLVTLDDGRLRLTEAGRPLMRVAAAAFDSYRRGAATRHSLAL